MPTPPRIDTDGLPAATAEVIEALVEALLAAHPGLTGFQLAGSYWNQSSQLPDADIDLRRFGEVTPGDRRVSGWQVLFEYRGRLIDLAEWVFGDLGHPQSLSLRDVTSFVRARILWERGSSLRNLRARLIGLLEDADWRRRKIDEALERCRVRFAELAAAHQHVFSLRKSVSPITDDGYFKHVFSTIVDELAGLISVLDFRPPSLARKAMLEIADGLSYLQLPLVAELVYGALGCASFEHAECRQWFEELEEVYVLTAAINGGALIKRDYHRNAIAAMMANGQYRPAIFPLWRGFEECRGACDLLTPDWLMPGSAPLMPDPGAHREIRNRIHADLARLRSRLHFGSDAQIGDRIDQSMAALEVLARHREHFYAHFGERTRSWAAAGGRF